MKKERLPLKPVCLKSEPFSLKEWTQKYGQRVRGRRITKLLNMTGLVPTTHFAILLLWRLSAKTAYSHKGIG